MTLKHMALGVILCACLVTNALPAFAVDEAIVSDSGIASSSDKSDFWSALVENKTISQQTYDAIKSYLNEHKPASSDNSQRPARRSPFEKMVSEGILAQETYDAITIYLEENQAQMSQRGKEDASGKTSHTHLADVLLRANVMTQSEHDAILAAMPQKPERTIDSSAERNSNSRKFGMLSDMLSAGIITQSEYDAIGAALPPRPARNPDL